MSIIVTFNGANYIIPTPNEVGWGTNLDNYFVAIAAGALQKTGGLFTLSAEADFGSSFGLKSLYYKSRGSNISTTGVLRLNNNSDSISWRNFANNSDLSLIVNSSDQLTFNGVPIVGPGVFTPNRAIITDGSGNLTSATTTSTEIGFVNGVTSSIQTQLNSTVHLAGTETITGSKTFTANVITKGGLSVVNASNNSFELLAPSVMTTYQYLVPATAPAVDGAILSSTILGTMSWTSTLAVANGGTGTTTSTGTGNVVLSNSPTLVTPALGTPSALVLTNATGLPLTTGVTGTLPVANGGTGDASFTAFQVITAGATSTSPLTSVALGASGQVLTSNGAGSSPTFQNVAGTGTVNSGTQFQLTYYATSTNAVSGTSNIITNAAGDLLLINGTVSAPSFAFQSNTGTGIYRSGTNELSIANAGVQTVRFTSDNRVGIGGAPDPINTHEILHVEGTSTGNNGVIDVASINNSTGGARVFAQSDYTDVNTTTLTSMNAQGTAQTGNWFSGGPAIARTSAFEHQNANNVIHRSLYTGTGNTGLTTHYWFTDQSSIAFSFYRNTGVTPTTAGYFQDGIWQINDGTAAAPAYSFQSDTASHHNGMYKITTDQIGFSTANTLRFDISTTAITSALPLAMGSNKITGLANGTATTDAVAYGQLQDRQSAIQSTSTTQFTTTNNTFTTTNLTGTITPSSSSSRVKITITNSLAVGTTLKAVLGTIARGTTNLGGTMGIVEFTSAAANQFSPASIVYIDSPATTSATTYNFQIRNTDGTTSVYAGDNNLTQIMILEEIQ